MELFRVFGSFFIEGGKEAEQQIDNIDQKAEGAGGKLGGMIGTAAKWGAAIGAGALAAGAALFGVANKAAGATDRIDKLSQKMGLSREGFQEWDYILSQNGVSIDSVSAGMKTFTNQIDELAKGGKVATDAFGALGMNYEDLADMTQEDIFEQVIISLQGMEDIKRRDAIANDLLGRSGQELIPLLNKEAGSIEELKQKAHDLNIIIGDEAIDAGVKFTDTWDGLKRSLGAVFTVIGTAVMPMFQNAADWIQEHMPEIQAVISTVFEVVSKAVGYVVDTVMPSLMKIFQTAYEVITAIWNKWGGEIGGTTTGLFDLIKSTVQNALAIVEGLIKVFGGILTGDFEMIKEGVMKIWSALWDWIKNLAGSAFEIGKNIVQGLWDGIKNMWGNMTKWVGDKVKDLLNMLNPFKSSSSKSGGGGNITWTQEDADKTNPEGSSTPPAWMGLATGGDVYKSGMFKVGEQGPEDVFLPAGAAVRPTTPTITFDRGAFEGAFIMDDYGVDRLMDRVMDRLAILGVTP